MDTPGCIVVVVIVVVRSNSSGGTMNYMATPAVIEGKQIIHNN